MQVVGLSGLGVTAGEGERKRDRGTPLSSQAIT